MLYRLLLLIHVLLEAPRAVLWGKFREDKGYEVHGWPARVVGLLLIGVVLHLVIGGAWLFKYSEGKSLQNLYATSSFAFYLGSLVLVAVLCRIYRSKVKG